MKKLPDLVVTVNSQVVSSNFDVFKQDADMFIESINQDLATDEDFVQAKATVKNCKFVEEQLSKIISDITHNSQDVGKLLSAVDNIKTRFSTVRLSLNSKVTDKEKILKNTALKKAGEEIEDFIACMNRIIDPFKIKYDLNTNVFSQAIKGKKTLKTIEKALSEVNFEIKKTIQEQVDLIKNNNDFYIKTVGSFGFLFHDLSEIIHKQHDDFLTLVNGRIDGYELASKTEDDNGKPVEVPVSFTTEPVGEEYQTGPISIPDNGYEPATIPPLPNGPVTSVSSSNSEIQRSREDSIIQASRDWYEAKAKELRLRKLIIEKLNKNNEIGTYKKELGKGYTIVCETSQNRKVSNYDAIYSVIDTLYENSIPTLDIFSREWKINQNEYEKLAPEVKKWVDDQCMIVTNESELKIIPPK